MAMWDIGGKACGQTVYNLLGGPVRDGVRVYPNGWSCKMLKVDKQLHRQSPASESRC